MSQTRRLAAILAADVAGYSRLIGADETGTAQALREHRSVTDPLVAEHGGRIVKTTGDGVLTEFSSVVGAVECALPPQQSAAKRDTSIRSNPTLPRRLLRYGPKISTFNWRERLAEETVPSIFGPAP